MTGLLRKGLSVSDTPELLDTDGVNLYALVARAARIAVVFRRGPARRTQVLLWRLDTDTVESGQWFKGRIYERRCDLSPDGALLALFCASFRKPLFSWTAITRPPYVAPLALWPKGDCWGGGGLFDGGVLKLNHGSGVADENSLKLDPAFRLPPYLSMQPLPMPLGQGMGQGEDDPIRVLRMERDGWQWIGTRPGPHIRQTKSNVYQVFDKPFVARRAIHGHASGRLFLQLQHHAIAENQGRWYLESAQVVDGENKMLIDLGLVDFADLDPNGDVLYGAKGSLYRLPLAQWTQGDSDSAPEPLRITDLNGERFEIVSAPQRAKVWP